MILPVFMHWFCAAFKRKSSVAFAVTFIMNGHLMVVSSFPIENYLHGHRKLLELFRRALIDIGWSIYS